MKTKRMKSTLCLLMVMLMMVTSFAFADPTEPDSTVDETIAVTEEVTEATDATEAPEAEPEAPVIEETVPDVETWPGTATDSEDYVEHIYRDTMSDTFPCQVTFITGTPSGFQNSTYVVFMGDDGVLYRASMIIDNHYETRMYLAPGHYTILDAGVYGNENVAFIKDITEFTVDAANDTATVSFLMKNIDNVVQDDNGNFYDSTGDEEAGKMKFYDTPYENITMAEDGKLYYTVTHTGEGPGSLVAYGFATGNYDVVMKVVKGGVVGEAELAISLDGGKNYAATLKAEELVETATTGLTFMFSTEVDTDEFVEGDTFEFSTIECFNVTTSYSLKDVRLMCVGHPMNSYDLTVEVLSSGGLGFSKVSITEDRGRMDEITATIPEDGVLKLEDDLTLVFSDLGGYTKGVIFAIDVVSNDTTIDYTPVYYLAVAAGILLFIGFIVLLLKKDKPATYHIHEYKWQQDEDRYN